MSRVYIETYGCALNQADSETIAGLLQADGFCLTQSIHQAELIIINTCTVKKRTYLNFVKRLKELRRLRRPLIVAGCVPSVYAESPVLKDVSFIGVNEVNQIVEVAHRVLAGELVQRKGSEVDRTRLLLPIARANPVIEIVPIAQGCLGECTYCQTRLARGRLHSYPVEHILARIRQAIQHAEVKEIWLTSQDTGAYGLDIGSNIVELLREILSIEGEFRLRLGMTNPEHLLPILDEILSIFTDNRIYKFLHIPLQSGSDRVLKAMNRKYSVGEFLKIIHRVRARFSEFSIATDVIAGFPGETEADFLATLSVLREIRPAVVNRSRFSVRPMTPAARMPQLPSSVVSERSRRLSVLVEELSREENQRWVGWCGEVLIDLQKRPDSLISRNFAYKPIIIPLDTRQNTPVRLGQFVKVNVVKATTFHLIGKLAPPEKNLRSKDADSCKMESAS
ncbi:tRNA (N(6)-L-threonylcarbamoyladenosine(37)-C(2))-methylthiotransferase [Candidatus Sumerlaeota bacterium]|nr:tRNA (N(6)-L-threonylcarbamoyladenosine(37)-C(2))-methylthiotransferase [Candidatus Sumerlaeota bacterium]